jgi:hypothetical protein
MKLLLVLLLAAVLIIGAIVLSSRSPGGPKPLSDLQVAQAWLQCVDCRGSFLTRIRDMPGRNRDTVTKFLQAALREGPDSTQVAKLDRGLYRTWRADSVYRAGRGDAPATSLSEFTAKYREGFRVMWQARAAVALGVIGSPEALASLNDALQLPVNELGDSAIRHAVQEALAGNRPTFDPFP